MSQAVASARIVSQFPWFCRGLSLRPVVPPGEHSSQPVALVALHIVDLGGNAIDTTSAAGRLMLVVLAGAAEMERNLTRERTRSAMAMKKSNGHRVGSIPYGYDLADDGTTLVPNESEQAVIADIREWRSRGRKLQQIAGALTERGIPTKTGRSNGWSHQAVARILSR